jgi:hypothetical protein
VRWRATYPSRLVTNPSCNSTARPAPTPLLATLHYRPTALAERAEGLTFIFNHQQNVAFIFNQSANRLPSFFKGRTWALARNSVQMRAARTGAAVAGSLGSPNPGGGSCAMLPSTSMVSVLGQGSACKRASVFASTTWPGEEKDTQSEGRIDELKINTKQQS